MVRLASLFLTLAACGAAETDAILVDQIALDGCSFVLEVGASEYGIDASSRPTVETIRGGGGRIPVRVRYSETGNMVTVECGHGARVERPAVTLHSIVRR